MSDLKQEQDRRCILACLPFEIIQMLCTFLHPHGLLRLAGACSSLRNLILGNLIPNLIPPPPLPLPPQQQSLQEQSDSDTPSLAFVISSLKHLWALDCSIQNSDSVEDIDKNDMFPPLQNTNLNWTALPVAYSVALLSLHGITYWSLSELTRKPNKSNSNRYWGIHSHFEIENIPKSRHFHTTVSLTLQWKIPIKTGLDILSMWSCRHDKSEILKLMNLSGMSARLWARHFTTACFYGSTDCIPLILSVASHETIIAQMDQIIRGIRYV
jgi:hypothetical protein